VCTWRVWQVCRTAWTGVVVRSVEGRPRRGMERKCIAAEHHDHRRHHRPVRWVALNAQEPYMDAPQRVALGGAGLDAGGHHLRHRSCRPVLPYLHIRFVAFMSEPSSIAVADLLDIYIQIERTYCGQEILRLLGVIVLPTRHDFQHQDAEAKHIRFNRVVPTHDVLGRHVSTKFARQGHN
jgi:hypothetical protein